MIYAYIRVSTDRQTVENQRFEINNFCEKQELLVDRWLEETVSGTKEAEKRKLGKLLKKLKKGDILICAELSRLGRSLLMIMSILHHCMQNDIQVWTIKDNFRLGKDIQSQVLAFAFGLSAQIERDLISMRTKEALARKKAEGVILGRPKGSKSVTTKLSGDEKRIRGYLKQGVSYSAIGRIMGCHRLTVSSFAKRLDDPKKSYKSFMVTDSDGYGDEDGYSYEDEPVMPDEDLATRKQLLKLEANKDMVMKMLKDKKPHYAIAAFFKVEKYAVAIYAIEHLNI